MKGTLLRTIGAGIMSLLAILAVPAGPADAGKPVVMAIRHSSAAGHTRIVIDCSARTPHTEALLRNPLRVVVTLQATPGQDLRPVAIDDDRVSRVRIDAAEGESRIIVDLKTAADYRLLDLPREGSRPDRVVIDLFAAAGSGTGSAAGGRSTAGPASGAPTPRPARVVPPPPRAEASMVVVVDAGHGGEDPGAKGFSLDEKNVCLALARKVVAEINRRPGYQARLSRDGDHFVPLRRRIQVAESCGADVFVSIHANASRNRSAKGTEVYFLSLSGATDEAARELARLENAADQVGGIAPEADDDLSSILFDMQQTDVLQKGSLLAQSVVDALRTDASLTTRGVKQAGFVVLKSPRIPSILVETAFITHPKENRLLGSGSFQTRLARRLADGIVSYFESAGAAAQN